MEITLEKFWGSRQTRSNDDVRQKKSAFVAAMKPKKTSPALPVAVQQWNRLLPMFSRTEASKVTFTVSGDKLYIQAPSQTIKRIADKLALLGAKAEPSSPYGAWGEKTEGESRWPYKS